MAKVNGPFLIGRRYSSAKRRNGFISFISFISMFGIALGVWALITVISVMNGFGNELRGRVLDVASHITVTGPSGWLADWQSLEPVLQQESQVIGYAPYINVQGLLVNNSAATGAIVRGIDPTVESRVSLIGNNVYDGELEDLSSGSYNVILGETLAFQLRAQIGDKITLISPQGQSSPAGLMPRLRRFTLTGTFSMDMNEVDSTLALINIEDAAKLFKAGQQVSGLRLKLDEVYDAREVGARLSSALSYQYRVDDWTRQYENYFRALEIERVVMFIILSLVVAVAAFNIVSTLVMVVTDKKADIAILRTIGLSPAGVMGVFFIQGAMSGVIGTLVGLVTGVLTALNLGSIIAFLERIFGFQVFPADVYVITNFPADLRLADVAVIVGVSLSISMLATLYPAWRASKMQPAEALRYE
ncbi:MAG: lipoprotein-releasing ABC transporter permease subunit [Pseudomonadota bacterium]